jgi:hypothetical protein
MKQLIETIELLDGEGLGPIVYFNYSCIIVL